MQPGGYAAAAAAAAAPAAAAGTYNNASYQANLTSTCKTCPLGTSTAALGADDVALCNCKYLRFIHLAFVWQLHTATTAAVIMTGRVLHDSTNAVRQRGQHFLENVGGGAHAANS
jgi:hypothetical protein